MTGSAPLRLLLGPQRPVVNLDTSIERARIEDGPIGVISAAWQEAEGDIAEVQRLSKNPLFDLKLYQRAEELVEADSNLHDAYRLRQQKLKQQQQLYRLRLQQLMIAAREILRATGDPEVITEERRHAISQLRALDRHHLRQLRKLNQHFEENYSVGTHSLLAEYAAAIAEDLTRCKTVLITGGNVMVLLNRLHLFGLGKLLESKNIIGWSAGAMVLCNRIVLFHDRMPQGRRDPEIIGEGLGILPDIVLLPDAKGRLRANDTSRVSLFSRRFSPAVCLTLDSGSMLLTSNQTFHDSVAVKHLTRSGNLTRVNTA